MKFSTVTSLFLLTASALAAPRSSKGSRHAQRRSSSGRSIARGTKTAHASPFAKTQNSAVVDKNGNATFIQYTGNWAGGVIEAPPAGETFNYAATQFTVPVSSAPEGAGDGTYSASIWAGIDGWNNGVILQAGIDFTVTLSGGQQSISYDSWYEWFPQDSFDFDPSQFSINAGDTIAITIDASSSTDGTVILENVSTGQSVSQEVTATDSTQALLGQTAEWIVEDYEQIDANGNAIQVPFVDFGTVFLENCAAGTSAGSQLNTDNAEIFEMNDANGNSITDVWFPDSSTVALVYV